MYNVQIKKLDSIFDKTLESIDNSKDEIQEISMFAKNEYLEMQEELIRFRIEATAIIEKVDELEILLRKSKTKLMTVNKNYKKYDEKEMRDIYEKTDAIRLQLAIEKEREANIIKRRNELEIRLKSVKQIYDKADKLFNDFNIAYSVLSGDFKKFAQQIEDINDKEIWGIKVIEAQELERKRIARDMHDGPTQKLSNLILKTELCIKLLDKDIDRTKLELHSLKLLIRATIDETRRLIHNLRPMSIDDLGLIPSIERLVDETKSEVDFEISFIYYIGKEIELDSIITIAIYRVAQEALNNIRKHSKAKKVIVELKIEENNLDLVVSDDGVGFDVDNVKLNYDDNRGFGISMMRERINLLMGEFNILSAINKGTTITVKLPITLRKEEANNEQNKNSNSR